MIITIGHCTASVSSFWAFADGSLSASRVNLAFLICVDFVLISSERVDWDSHGSIMGEINVVWVGSSWHRSTIACSKFAWSQHICLVGEIVRLAVLVRCDRAAFCLGLCWFHLEYTITLLDLHCVEAVKVEFVTTIRCWRSWWLITIGHMCWVWQILNVWWHFLASLNWRVILFTTTFDTFSFFFLCSRSQVWWVHLWADFFTGCLTTSLTVFLDKAAHHEASWLSFWYCCASRYYYWLA